MPRTDLKGKRYTEEADSNIPTNIRQHKPCSFYFERYYFSFTSLSKTEEKKRTFPVFKRSWSSVTSQILFPHTFLIISCSEHLRFWKSLLMPEKFHYIRRPSGRAANCCCEGLGDWVGKAPARRSGKRESRTQKL